MEAKLVAFLNYRRLEIKRKGGLGELGSKGLTMRLE
jgi:hypothetical protein